ncbi:MAG: hypothetical protein P4L43_01905 [Syntrophobacteraceae bacterium]|nr:hypothetical protein [Syntrophobacteraceae bacterium]
MAIDKRHFFDMNQFETIEELDALAEELTLEELKEKVKLHDIFLDRLESKVQIKFKVIQLRVPPPREDYCNYPMKSLGPPFCYVARDSQCIDVVEVK